MGKSKKPKIEQPQISKEEEVYQLIFDFAYWLENGVGRAGVAGATELLRKFLQEKNVYNL